MLQQAKECNTNEEKKKNLDKWYVSLLSFALSQASPYYLIQVIHFFHQEFTDNNDIDHVLPTLRSLLNKHFISYLNEYNYTIPYKGAKVLDYQIDTNLISYKEKENKSWMR